jgi:hypothetical protein
LCRASASAAGCLLACFIENSVVVQLYLLNDQGFKAQSLVACMLLDPVYLYFSLALVKNWVLSKQIQSARIVVTGFVCFSERIFLIAL